MRRPRGEVDEERFVGHQRLLLAHPTHGAIGEILGQVVALLGGRRRLDRGRAVVQRRVPLVVLASDEAVERLEPATTRRPGVERTHRRRLPHRHLVTLAELRRRVAVQLQCQRQRGLCVRPQRAVPRRGCCSLGDASHADRMVVTAGQHRLTSRRAECRCVEAVELEAACRQPLSDRCSARTSERARGTEADVVDAARSERWVRPPVEATARWAGTRCRDPWRQRWSSPTQGGPESAAWCVRAGRVSWSSDGSLLVLKMRYVGICTCVVLRDEA